MKFAVARAVGKTVEWIEHNMSLEEFAGWAQFLAWENESRNG